MVVTNSVRAAANGLDRAAKTERTSRSYQHRGKFLLQLTDCVVCHSRHRTVCSYCRVCAAVYGNNFRPCGMEPRITYSNLAYSSAHYAASAA